MSEPTSIGQIIRELRRERHLTQEELAEQLNVTSQAISKWESGIGLPDISQVVPLANVFGVPTDVLFGRVDRSNEEIERIIEEIEKPLKAPDGEEFEAMNHAYEEYQAALKIYPNNIKLLVNALGQGHNVAWLYKERGEEEKTAEIFNECIREANVIINYSRDIQTILNARQWLIRTYCALKQYDKAEAELEHFPKWVDLTYGRQRAWVLRSKNDTDEVMKQYSVNIGTMLGELSYPIYELAASYAFDKGNWEDAYRTFRVIPDIIDAVYGGAEYTAPLHSEARHYVQTAVCCMKLNRHDEAIDWLEKMAAHCIANGKYYNKTPHVDIPLLRDVEYRWFGDSYEAKETILENLSYGIFDPIRDTERFKAIIARANALEE